MITLDTKLMEEVEQRYGLSLLEDDPQQSGSGEVHILKTDQGPRVLKKHDSSFERDRLAFQHIVLGYLNDKGLNVFPIAYPIRGTTETIFNHQGSDYALYVFKDGHFHSWNIEELKDAARTLARFHQATVPFTTFQGNDDSFLGRCAQSTEDLILKIQQAEGVYSSNIAATLQEALPALERLKIDFDQATQEERYLPAMRETSLIHRDYHQRNVLFKDDQVSGVFDLDGVAPGKRIYDLAFAIHEFNSIYEETDGTFKLKEVDMERARTFLEAYQSTFPIPGPVEDLILLTTAYRHIARLEFELKKGANADEIFLQGISRTVSLLPNTYASLKRGE